MWFGITRTFSPTRHFREQPRVSTNPCSSFIFSNKASGASRIRPNPSVAVLSDEKVLDPPSRMTLSATEVDATVVRMYAAQSLHSHAPANTVLRSLKMYVPGRISFIEGARCE